MQLLLLHAVWEKKALITFKYFYVAGIVII